jgi:hypothetical protein
VMLSDNLDRIFIYNSEIYQVEVSGYDYGTDYDAASRVVWALRPWSESYTTKWWYCIQESELPEGVIKACGIWKRCSYDISISEFLAGLFNE